MSLKKKNIFSKRVILVIVILLSLSILTPISQGLIINSKQDNPGGGKLPSEYFSITIHRIKQEDEIDPWPYGEADWLFGHALQEESR